MCKIRIVHFSAHDHRDVLATNLFSTPGDGDYTVPTVIRKSEACGCPPAFASKILDNNPEAGRRFEVCPFHHCCVLDYKFMLCRWFFENRDVLELDDLPDVELHCPNAFVVGEFYPMNMVVEKRQPVIKQEPGVNDEEEEEEWSEIPVFPAGELFYSDQLLEGSVAVDDAASLGLYRDRVVAINAGQDLWIHKEVLQGAISIASHNLDQLEQALGDDDGVRDFARSPGMFLLRWRIAQGLVRSARWAEFTAAGMFIDMMKYTGLTLAALNKMPADGQSVTAADGSYSVSREQLDLGELDCQAVIDACDGPLKQAAKLEKRLQAITKVILRIPKRNNNKRPARNLRRGPVPAMRGAKTTRK